MKKKFLTAACCVLLVCSLYADSTVSEDLSDAWDQVKEDTKQFWSDFTGAIKGAGREIDEQVQEISVNAFAAKWKFTNGKYCTILDFTSDGNVSLEQTTRTGSKIWRGTYDVKPGTVTLYITESTDGFLFKNTKPQSEVWTVKYSRSGFSKMQFTSDDIPDDTNGYDFSNPTIFLLVEEDEAQ